MFNIGRKKDQFALEMANTNLPKILAVLENYTKFGVLVQKGKRSFELSISSKEYWQPEASTNEMGNVLHISAGDLLVVPDIKNIPNIEVNSLSLWRGCNFSHTCNEDIKRYDIRIDIDLRLWDKKLDLKVSLLEKYKPCDSWGFVISTKGTCDYYVWEARLDLTDQQTASLLTNLLERKLRQEKVAECLGAATCELENIANIRSEFQATSSEYLENEKTFF